MCAAFYVQFLPREAETARKMQRTRYVLAEHLSRSPVSSAASSRVRRVKSVESVGVAKRSVFVPFLLFVE